MILSDCIKEIIFSFRLSMLNTNLLTRQLYIRSHKHKMRCFISAMSVVFHYYKKAALSESRYFDFMILFEIYILGQAMKNLSCLLQRR